MKWTSDHKLRVVKKQWLSLQGTFQKKTPVSYGEIPTSESTQMNVVGKSVKEKSPLLPPTTKKVVGADKINLP